MPVDPNRKVIYDELREEVDGLLRLQELKLPGFQAAERVYVWNATVLPTNSHYVPVFTELLEELETAGQISPERTILVETTTGNAGAAAAYVANRLGYPIVLFIPADMPATRIDDVRYYLKGSADSEVKLTPEGRYVEGLVDGLRSFLKDHKKGYKGREIMPVNHSRRQKSVEVMTRLATGLLQKLPPDIKISTCVLALGNGTTSTGIGRAVKEHNPSAKVIGVEPLESPWFYTKKHPGRFEQEFQGPPQFQPHRLIGTGGWGVEFPNVDLSVLDSVQLVEEAAWRGKLRELADLGYPVGHSTAACQCVIAKLAVASGRCPQRFFSVFYDPIHKY